MRVGVLEIHESPSLHRPKRYVSKNAAEAMLRRLVAKRISKALIQMVIIKAISDTPLPKITPKVDPATLETGPELPGIKFKEPISARWRRDSSSPSVCLRFIRSSQSLMEVGSCQSTEGQVRLGPLQS